MADNTITLAFLASRMELLTKAVTSLKDDMGVMMAILQRIDGTLSGLNGLCRFD